MGIRIQVVAASVREGVNPDTRKPWKMNTLQCVLLTDPPQVGELTLPRDHPLVTEPGLYNAEFGPSVDYKTKKVYGVVVSMSPVQVQHRGDADKRTAAQA